MMGALIVVVALAFVTLPLVSSDYVQGISQILIVGFGVLLLVLVSGIRIITRLYRRTAADEAFVRTGMGGQKVIIDGGALVVPAVHELIPVSLSTMRLDVERTGPHALITGDKLRADIEAEFYIKVQKERDDVVNAATSLGERSVTPENVKELVFDKLVSALRTVAATKDLHDLNEKRDEFAHAVQNIVEKDLKHNGLTLETVTVSMLDQTPPDKMRADSNVFDAEGTRKIAEITQKMRVETNAIARKADKEVKQQDVEKDKFVYTQELGRATAEAIQDSDIQQAQAEAAQKADTFTAEQEEQARVREVERDQAIQVSGVEKAKQIQVANEQREQAQQEAAIKKQKAVADRNKEKAEAEAAQKAAETEREKEAQNVQTVAITEEAKRTAEKGYIAKAREIDQDAYEKERQAEAERVAAAREAEARKTKAVAEKEALTDEAEGKTASEMVPVNVERKKVEVEQSRVNDVTKPQLAAKAEFQEISVKLELGLKNIEVNGEVQKAFADAMGLSLSEADMNIFGDPTTLGKMMTMFRNGQALSTGIDGFMKSVDPDALGLIGDIVSGVKDTLTGIFQGIFGKTLEDSTVQALAAKITEQPEILEQIQEKVVSALKSPRDEAGLAQYLAATFGDDFDLKSVSALIETIKEKPAILGQLNQAFSKLQVAGATE